MAVTTILVESDTKKLDLWKAYITEYDRETCKTSGDDLSGLGTPQTASGETMEEVLDLMGKASGGVALIYAHANPHGLIMRVTTNARSAQSDVITGISRAWKAVFEMIPLRSGKENKTTGKLEFFIDLPKAKALLKELKLELDKLPGGLSGKLADPATLVGRADADLWFDKWMDLMAEACLGGSNTQTDLRRVCRAMQKVRDLKFDRVEVRACNIGRDVATLNALKEFFGVKKVCAPKVTMFFGKAGVNLNPQNIINQGAKDLGGFRGTTFTPGKSGQALNKLPNGEAAMASGRRNRIFESGSNVQSIMQLTETAPFQFSARIFSVNSTTMTAFLQAHYSATALFKAGSKSVPVGGMWCISDPKAALPYLMPLEAAYRDFLEVSA